MTPVTEEKQKWKFKEGAEPQGGSDGFWYDMTQGGYIRPEELLEDSEQLEKLNKALSTVISFERALEEAELLNEF